MKRFISILVALAFINMTFNIFRTNAHTKQTFGEFREREEINRSFTLSPGAQVNISSVSGPVEIRTSEGNTAQVHIVRMARNREDFQLRKFIIEQTLISLVVRGDDESRGRSSSDVQIREQVVLELPRQIKLTVSSVSGPVTCGSIAGPMQASSISGPLTIGEVGESVTLSSISGPVRVGLVIGHLRASSVSGNLSAVVARLGGRGIQLSSISGPVELRFQDELNADLDVTNISGRVHLDVPHVAFQGATDSSNVRARIGSGGSPISMSSISGNVRFARK
jgi:DUF4097 and DUF4098 domain-containing protein YvlB